MVMVAKKKTKKVVRKPAKKTELDPMLTQAWKGVIFIVGIIFGLGFFANYFFLGCHDGGGFCSGPFDQDRAKLTFLLGVISASLISFAVTKNKQKIKWAILISAFVILMIILGAKG